MSTSRRELVDLAQREIDALMAHRRRAMCAEQPHRHVSMPQFYIMMLLQERGAMTVSDLANLLNVSNPSASSILDRMEEHGMVERTRDLVDRRVVHVDITAAGRHTAEEMMGMKHEQLERVFAVMSDEELEHFARGAGALVRALTVLQGDASPVAQPTVA